VHEHYRLTYDRQTDGRATADSEHEHKFTFAKNTHNKTSSQSNSIKRPHRPSTWTVQSYSPGCANMHPHVTNASLGQPKSTSQMVSRSVQPLLHSSRQKVLYFTMGRPFLLKIAPLHGEIWTIANTWLLGPIRVHNPNGNSIGSAVFVMLIIYTDRQTDRPCYSVCNNRPHLNT